ncbi:MAG: M48 family metalloprotease [Phycisphaerales bacterium]|nr:MAG: M48 family metalloprotease [Phycisphaerales bacterium]
MAVQRGRDGSRQLLMLTARHYSYFSSVGLWLSVSVRPLSSRQTEVAAALVDPVKGELFPLSTSGLQNAPKVIIDRNTYSAISTRLSDIRSSVKDDPIAQASVHSHMVVNGFFNELAMQLLAPGRWKAKYVASGRAVGFDPDHKVPGLKRRRPFSYGGLENRTGNFASAVLRRSHVVIDDPAVSGILDEVVGELLQAAGQAECKVNTYVLASPDVNAFVMPNGDVFVCSALLDTLEDRNELAFILGHELDHLLHHDTLARLKKAHSTRVAQYTIVGMTSAIAPILGPALGITSGVAGAATTSTSTMIAQQAASQAIQSTVASVAGVLGDAVSAAIIEGYSQGSELRADGNGARYALAAGYDPAASLGVLATLQAIEAEATNAQTAITSQLINSKPGLEKRTDRMRDTLTKLGVASAD